MFIRMYIVYRIACTHVPQHHEYTHKCLRPDCMLAVYSTYTLRFSWLELSATYRCHLALIFPLSPLHPCPCCITFPVASMHAQLMSARTHSHPRLQMAMSHPRLQMAVGRLLSQQSGAKRGGTR